MKNLMGAASILFLSACSEQMEEHYATWHDAEKAGAIERGWVPSFVPASATGISDSHDLDRNTQTLQFTVPLTDISMMVSRFPSIKANDENAADELAQELGFADGSDSYLVCSSIRNGVLLVDRDTGQAAYNTTVRWTDNDCR